MFRTRFYAVFQADSVQPFVYQANNSCKDHGQTAASESRILSLFEPLVKTSFVSLVEILGK